MSNTKAKEIFGIKAPKAECTDKKCPFHGTLNVKKKSFMGTVVSDKMHHTVVVEWSRRIYIPKYERYTNKRTKISVHNPECINAKEGDVVKIYATRPISKMVHATIVEIMGQEKNYELKKEGQEEGQVDSKKGDQSKQEVVEEESESKKETVKEEAVKEE